MQRPVNHPGKRGGVSKQSLVSSPRKKVGLVDREIFGRLRGTRRCPLHKKYFVRLSDEERGVCQDVVQRWKGTSEKVKRAQRLLKADADGPGPSPV